MKIYYCWRCKEDLPFLEEHEWEQISPLFFKNTIERIKAYRREHRCSLSEARFKLPHPATEKFEELTGYPNFFWEAIYHHRLAAYGPECPSCKRLWRTNKAKRCAHCGLDSL